MRMIQGKIQGKNLRLSIAAAVAVLAIAGAARADDVTGLPGQANGPVVGIGIICNTNDQAEQFISLRQGGQDIVPAMATVNEQAKNPRACGLAAVAFVPDRTMDTKTMGGKLVRIVRVNVVAGYNGSSWQQVAATVQYAIVEAKGEEI
jgi:hypothetical protein